jgi:hypothetical protein
LDGCLAACVMKCVGLAMCDKVCAGPTRGGVAAQICTLLHLKDTAAVRDSTTAAELLC